tara:strand:- start:150 stop:413 length:264 start_codon:yes stop_codon:yes gene_type:complete
MSTAPNFWEVGFRRLRKWTMKKLIKIIFSFPFDIIWMSLLFMWLMPFGTFDYSALNFYLCILLSIIIAVITRLLLKKYQKDYMGKVK